MKLRQMALAAAFAGAATMAGALPSTAEDASQFMLVNAYWTGPYAAPGSAFGGGMIDYFRLLNERDGGINGVKLSWEKCETQYNNARIVECYERYKDKLALFHPMSTGGTYAVLEKSMKDEIPVLTIGYGRTDGTDGRVFPYLFPLITNYWNQDSAIVRFIGTREGGMDKLKGKKIADVYIDVASGKETIPVLEAEQQKHGFEMKLFPVSAPGLDQKATWLQIRQYQPDWVILRGWGVMNPTSIKEAARIGFPADHIVTWWWSGSEEDAVPAGDAAEGYISAGFHPAGTDFPVVKDILKTVYDKSQGELPRERVGSIYYNRAVVWAIVSAEVIRDTMKMFGNRPVTGKEVQQALEKFEMSPERIAKLGATGLVPPFKVSCLDHEGGGSVRFLQWKGGKWNPISDWISGDRDLTGPMIRASAEKYAKEQGLPVRDCKG